MKIPILLKVLQISKTSNPQFPTSRKGDEGFSLLEMMMIVLIIGILTSIAVPGWLAFINNQRVRTVNDRVFQSLRTAQSEAKRSKRDVRVTFYTSSSNPSVDPPTVEIDTNPAEPDPLKKEIRKETFSSGGEIKQGTIVLSTNLAAATLPNSITFDYQGNPSTAQFVVTVAPSVPPNSPPNISGKKCVIVETVLGAMRTAEGTGCP